jgi:hypothetical protein
MMTRFNGSPFRVPSSLVEQQGRFSSAVLNSYPDGLHTFAGQIDPKDLPALGRAEDRNGYPDIIVEFRLRSFPERNFKKGPGLKCGGFIDGFYGYECNNHDCQYDQKFLAIDNVMSFFNISC